MTRYLPLLFCLACQTADPTGAGLIGPPGPQGPPGEKGEKGDPAPVARQLHLIVADTGEDLGLFAGSTSAWSERVGAVVNYTSQISLLYAEVDCRGVALMNYGVPMQGVAILGPGGTLLRPMTRAVTMAFRSARESDGSCKNLEVSLPAAPYVDTGVVSRKYAPGDLSIEPR